LAGFVLTKATNDVAVDIRDVVRKASDAVFLGRDSKWIEDLAVEIERHPFASHEHRLPLFVIDSLGARLSC